MSLQSVHVSRIPVFDEVMERPIRDAMAEVRDSGGSYGDLVAARSGSRLGASIRLYYNGYVVKDGSVILGALTPANRDQMRRALGITDDPTASPDFDMLNPEDIRAAEELAAWIRDTMRTKTMDEWVEIFTREGAPISKVNFPEDMSGDPQVEAMGFLSEFEHEMTGHEKLVGPIVFARNSPTGSPRPSPTLGRHTEEVLSELGLPANEVEALRMEKAFG
jgi:formyl-CoA transferase/CoA:oxalate CoA-transferase